MKIIDISPVISEQIAVWPGDVSFSRKISQSLEGGHNIDLSSISTTVHLGAHTDAPSHFAKGGPSIESLDLSPYIGPCQVILISLGPGERITSKDLGAYIRAPRVLFKTGSFPNPNIFNEDFCSLSAELIEFLAAKECVLVGIDTPSIDPFNDKILESHQALAKTGLRNIEGLVLTDVLPGLYNLVALPLPIKGADASPVRAILIKT
jgi:arylformamidase